MPAGQLELAEVCTRVTANKAWRLAGGALLLVHQAICITHNRV